MSPPIQLQRIPRRKKPAPTRALLFLALLLIVLCTGLAGCSAQAAMHRSPLQPPTSSVPLPARGSAQACTPNGSMRRPFNV